MQEDEFCTIWVGLMIICLYPADDVRVSISRLAEVVISLQYNFKHLVLKSPVMTEQIESSLFI